MTMNLLDGQFENKEYVAHRKKWNGPECYGLNKL